MLIYRRKLQPNHCPFITLFINTLPPPPLSNLTITALSSLQDQDGASAWTPLDQPQYVGRSLLRPVDSSAYEIASTFDLFKKLVLSQDGFDEIKKGELGSCSQLHLCLIIDSI